MSIVLELAGGSDGAAPVGSLDPGSDARTDYRALDKFLAGGRRASSAE